MGQLFIPGTAAPPDVLTGKSFSAGTNYIASGSMPNNGSLGTITPGRTAMSIPAGYTSGGTVAGDANLIADNILGGKTIFGVAGIAKRRASGSLPHSSNGVYLVNGLPVKPSYVFFQYTHDGSRIAIYNVEGDPNNNNWGFVGARLLSLSRGR